MQTGKPYPPGSVVPGTVYRVAALLEMGGMGCVYDVEDTTVGKRYVLKTLLAGYADRADLVTRMAKEARTLARIAHPNIVDVVTAGVTGDELRLPFFVMERLKGWSLRHLLASRGALPLDASLRIAIDLLDALDHAHGLGVVHRDVKPENVFLASGPGGITTTKLLDFGVMRLTSEASALTAGRFIGTMRYAAPEQLAGGEVGPHVDVYAAALVLYEMLAGRGPFDGAGDETAVAEARLVRAPPRLLPWVVVPKTLDDLVASALAKDVGDRAGDAFTLAARLRSYVKPAAPRGATTQRTTVELLVPPAFEPPPAAHDTASSPAALTLAEAPTFTADARDAASTLVDAPSPEARAQPRWLPPLAAALAAVVALAFAAAVVHTFAGPP